MLATIRNAYAIVLLGLVSLARGPAIADEPPPVRGPQPPPWKPFNLYSLLDPAERRAELERRHLAGGSFPALLERISRGLVAAPYLLSPLGEGAGVDPDPRLRFDAFDCTTFVETVIALAWCADPEGVRNILDRVRYDERTVSFAHRRHLMTSQWIPGLVADGFVEDVTAQVGGARTRQIRLKLGPKRWRRRRVARRLELPADRVPSGTFTLPYLTIDDATERTARVPLGTIVNVIRADVPRTPDVVTHQGLVITRPGETRRYVRHASPVSKRVIDESLAHMLWRYQRRERKWRIIGVNFLRIREPRATPRAERRASR